MGNGEGGCGRGGSLLTSAGPGRACVRCGGAADGRLVPLLQPLRILGVHLQPDVKRLGHVAGSHVARRRRFAGLDCGN